MAELKSEQQAFLAECEHEFANRFTIEDEEFKAIYESGIPPPPIMNNWYPRNKRGRGGRYRDFRDRRYNNQEYGRSYNRERDDREHDSYRDREAHESYRNRGAHNYD